jgi:surface antigen
MGPARKQFGGLALFVAFCLAAGSAVTFVLAAPAAASGTGDDYPSDLRARGLGAGYDDWDFAVRNCTSFAAWRLNQQGGLAEAPWVFKNNMTSPINGVKVHFGNASTWDEAAGAGGWVVDNTPTVGAVAQTDANHVAIVMAVNENRTVVVEDYNYLETGRYKTRTVASSAYRYLHIFDQFPSRGSLKHQWYQSNYNTSSPPGVNDFSWGRTGDIPLAGNWDAVGGDTVGLRRGSTFYLSNYNQAGPPNVRTFSWGRATDIPIVGDWDGDGKDTIGLRRGNRFYLSNNNQANPPGVISFKWGRATDIPIAGNWDGVGGDTVGLRRGSDHSFYLSNHNQSSPPNVSHFGWGRPADIPIVGNWDGVGGDTVGLKRGTTFYLSNYNRSSPPDVTSFAWGRSYDIPLVGNWDNYRGDTVGLAR